MAIFSFFKTPKPKKFNFKPRYYDANKERINEIMERYANKDDAQPEAMKTRISQGFRSKGLSDRRYESKIRRKSNRTLLIVLVALALISFLLLSKYSTVLVEMVQ